MDRHFAGTLCVAVALALASSPAASHVTLEKSKRQPNAPYKAMLRVPHGCGGAPTIAFKVLIPEGIIAAKPMPKAGWTLDIAKDDYARAYAFYHGSTLAKGATSIAWKDGSLPDDTYDEFVFVAFVSDAFKPGDTITFSVMQTCAAGKSTSWSETAKPGQDPHALKAPAPVLRIDGGFSASPASPLTPITTFRPRSMA